MAQSASHARPPWRPRTGQRSAAPPAARPCHPVPEVLGGPEIPLEHDGSGYPLTFITDSPDDALAVAAVGGVFAWHRVRLALVNGTGSWPLPDGVQVDRVQPGTAIVTGPRADRFVVTG